MDVRPGLLPLLLVAGIIGTPLAAMAQEPQRCIGPDGSTVFTDRRCEDLGAVNRLPPPTAAGSTLSVFRNNCPRRLSDLVHEVSAAITSRDVNRLASVYLWSGVSNEGANRILDRLDAMVERPLVDIVPIRPEPLPATEAVAAVDGMTGEDSNKAQQPTHDYRQRPTRLRVVQTLRNSATPSDTTFNLHRSYNCFWITL